MVLFCESVVWVILKVEVSRWVLSSRLSESSRVRLGEVKLSRIFVFVENQGLLDHLYQYMCYVCETVMPKNNNN